MSRRLTTYLRSTILSRVLVHRFKGEEEAFAAREAALADTVYCLTFSEERRAMMNSLPEGWLPETNAVHATISGGYQSLSLADQRRFPYDRNGGCLGVYDGGTPVAVTYETLRADRKVHREAKAQARAAAVAVLESVTTVGALLTRWPEVAPFVPDEEVVHLPALPLDSVNRLLGLGPIGQDAKRDAS